MDMQGFVPAEEQEPIYSHVTKRKHKVPYPPLDQNMNSVEVESMYSQEGQGEPVDSMPDAVDQSVGKLSQTKIKMNSMKHSFVKKCHSFKKKVKKMKNRGGDQKTKTTEEMVQPETAQLTETMKQETREAWVRSPVRTRLRTRQLSRQQQDKTDGEMSIRRKLSLHKKPSRSINGLASDITSIKDRLGRVETKLGELETRIPVEMDRWKNLHQQCRTSATKAARKDAWDEPDKGFDETSLKRIEAEIIPSGSSGLTSDEVYVVPDASSSSQDNQGHLTHPEYHMMEEGHMTKETDHMTQEVGPFMYASITSQEDSLPSGIPRRLKMGVQVGQRSTNDVQQTTSTPVTNREISFRSASREYEKTHRIKHTNITSVNVDHSYTKPPKQGCAESNRSHSSLPDSTTARVLSPEQQAVKSFLKKRRSSGSLRSFQESPNRDSPIEFNVNHSMVYESPPMASSTMCNDQSSGMSPLSAVDKADFGRSSQYYSTRSSPGGSKLEETKISGTDRFSSPSNLSYTFRNDSQMIQTNAEEDLQGYTKNYSFRHRRGSDQGEEKYEVVNSVPEENRITVQADVEVDGPERYSPLTEISMKREYEQKLKHEAGTTDDGGSLTNVTDFTGDYINSFAESGGESQNRSRWANKDVFLFSHGRSGRSRPASTCSRSTTRGVDETGDGQKPPVPVKRRSLQNSSFDYLKEAEDHLKEYKGRKSGGKRRSGDLTLEKLPRPSALNALDTDSTDGMSEVQETMVQSFSSGRQSTMAQSFPNTTKEFEELEARLKNESKVSQAQQSKPMTLLERLEAQMIDKRPVARERDRSISRTSSVDTETRENARYLDKRPVACERDRSISRTSSVDTETRENARYHFLNDKGMVKISSPSLKIIGSNGSGRRNRRPLRERLAEEDMSDNVDSGSEISGVYIDSHFHTFKSPGTVSGHSETVYRRTGSQDMDNQSKARMGYTEAAPVEMDIEHYQDKKSSPEQMESEILEECLRTTDESQETWKNVLNWMNREGHADEDAEEREALEQELKMLMQQRENQDEEQSEVATPTRHLSQHDESVYYSFQGQSSELRAVMSPGLESLPEQGEMVRYRHEEEDEYGQGRLDDDEFRAGLLYTIQHGNVQDVADLLNSDCTISELEIKDALMWALETKNFDISMLLLDDVVKILRASEGETWVDIFPAYRENRRWQPIFVILSKQNYQGEWDTFMGLPVYRRRFDLISPEAAIVVNSQMVKNNPLSVEDFQTMKRAINEAKLHEYHSKVTVVNACSCRSKKEGQILQQEICIVVHCLLKGFIPFHEDPFPKEVFGIPLDVREGFFRRGIKTPMGSSNDILRHWNDEMSVGLSSQGSGAGACQSGSYSGSNNGSSQRSLGSQSSSPGSKSQRSPGSESFVFTAQRLQNLENSPKERGQNSPGSEMTRPTSRGQKSQGSHSSPEYRSQESNGFDSSPSSDDGKLGSQGSSTGSTGQRLPSSETQKSHVAMVSGEGDVDLDGYMVTMNIGPSGDSGIDKLLGQVVVVLLIVISMVAYLFT